jgi:hypothetical protein
MTMLHNKTAAVDRSVVAALQRKATAVLNGLQTVTSTC